jgi:hypothetical protein
MISADHVRPHERRRDNEHDGNSDDPEAGEQQIHTTSEMNVRSENVQNVGMVMFDRPHVVEVHALRKRQGNFSSEKRDKLTKYPVSKVSGKNKMVHNVKRRLHGC